MLKRFMPLALAIAVTGAAGCADDRREAAGGGGGATTTQQQQQQERRVATGDDWWDQASANLSNDLSTEGRDFAEAYTRAPWVHANLAAGDWERALDDLQFIRDQLNDLNRDNDVTPAIKGKIATLMPLVKTLDSQIQKHDKASIQSASRLVTAFTAVTNDSAVLAWMGDRTRGGGAGRGDDIKHK